MKRASAALIGALVLLGPLQSAHASCIPGRSDSQIRLYAGWSRHISSIPGGSIGDAYSVIYQYNAWVHPNGINTASWVAITNYSTPLHWVQIGTVKWANGVRQTYDEWTDANGIPQQSFGAPSALGSFTPYEVYWNPGAQRLETYQNGAFWGSHVRYFTMRDGQVYSETKNLASQMPGGTGWHEQFLDGLVANLSGSYFDFNGTPLLSAPTHHAFAVGGTRRIDTWDKACSL